MNAPKGFTVTWRAERRCWVGKYRTPAGKWPQKVIPQDAARGPRDRAKALAWLEAFAANAIPLGVEPRPRPGGRLLRDAFEAWKEIRKNDERTSPATLRGYDDLFRNVVLKPFTLAPTRGLFSLADKDVVTLGTDFSLLRSWIRAVSKGRSAGRVRAAYSALRSFFDDAIVEKWFRGENPLRNDALVREQPPLPTARERGGVVFVPIEVAQPLLRSPRVPLWRRVRFALIMTAGLREGEISGLTWGKVHLLDSQPHVEVDRARRLLRAKDETLGPVKTRTSNRGLPLHTAAVEALLEWAEDDGGVQLLLGRSPRPSDPVFPSMRAQDRGGFARPDVAEMLRDDLAAAGLPSKDAKGRNFTAHALRKTFGTWLEQAGADELTRKRLMGHGAHDVTADYYTGDNFRKMAEAVASLPIVWQTGVPYAPPPRPASHQERVMAYVAAHPAAKPPEVAEALGIRRSTAAWIMSRMRSGRLVPALVPRLVPTAPSSITNVRKSLEPRVGIEPTTCALRKRANGESLGVDHAQQAAKGSASAHQPNDRTIPNDRAPEVPSSNGTTASGGRASVAVDGVEVSTDVLPGEPTSAVTARLAQALRQRGVSAISVGAALRGRCSGGRS